MPDALSRDGSSNSTDASTPASTALGSHVELDECVLQELASRWRASGPRWEERFDALLQSLARPPSATTVRFNPRDFPSGAAEAARALEDEMAEAEASALAAALPKEEAAVPCASRPAGAENKPGDGDGGADAAAGKGGQWTTSHKSADQPPPHGRRRWASAPHSVLPDVLTVRLDGARSGRPTPHPDEVIVGAACGHSVMRGADVFAPGVLAVGNGVAKGGPVSVWADVDGACVRGTAVAAFAGRNFFVGNGVAADSRLAFFRRDASDVRGVFVTVTEPLCAAPRFRGSPRFALQNAPSCVAVHELEVAPGLAVLDMCAAPGGKTAHLATLLGGQGRLVALERSARRAQALSELMAARHPWVEVVKADAAKAVSVVRPDGGSGGAAGRFPPETFDCVLLDAPCTGLGQRPRLRQSVGLAELETTPRLQRKLLAAGAALLKPGGLLVYSTCTVNPLENEAVVAWAVGAGESAAPAQHGGDGAGREELGLELVAPTHRFGGPGLLGQGLDKSQCALVQRFDPAADPDVIGFFVAKFRKREAGWRPAAAAAAAVAQ